MEAASLRIDFGDDNLRRRQGVGGKPNTLKSLFVNRKHV